MNWTVIITTGVICFTVTVIAVCISLSSRRVIKVLARALDLAEQVLDGDLDNVNVHVLKRIAVNVQSKQMEGADDTLHQPQS